jgi:hypothetical protein
VQDAASAAVIGLIPAELNVKSLYEDLDRRRGKSGNERTVALQLQVGNGYTPIYNKANESTSVDALRTGRHSKRFATGERGISKILRRN